MKKYLLTIDEKQLETLRKATEAFSRISTGQIHYAIEEGWDTFKLETLKREALERHCKGITRILSDGLFDGFQGSYGIYSQEINKNAVIAYDIHQVLRHQQWKEIPEGERPKHVVSSSVSIMDGGVAIDIKRIE